MDTKILGSRGEQLAAQFLERLGYQLVAANVRILSGEIDLIMRDGQTIVFVEVKTRASDMAGNPLDAITKRKLYAISKMAEVYMVGKNWHNRPYRIDAIGIQWHDGKPQIEHIPNITG